jgi:UDP-galactopyranose mutase
VADSILIVGAGFSGAVVARELAEQGRKITVIDKRPHLAGNAYDCINEYGIRVHQYGPHIFHTSNQRVVEWLSRFTEWLPYKHKVKAMLSDGRLVTLPVNKETAEIVGKENIIDIFYRPYTQKMWGVEIEQLDPEIVARVKPREDQNEYYFPDDAFQAMPKDGYNRLFEKIFAHDNIEVLLNREFSKADEAKYLHVFNSMPIDEYFDYCFGELPYRSIKFHTHTFPIPKIFPVATVNYTHNEPYTRATEWKNFPGHGENTAQTTVTIEEPCDYRSNNFERYYPVKDIHGRNRELYKKYQKVVAKNMTFIGRCGLYAYLDMHQAVSTALAVAANYLASDNILRE